MAFRDKVVIVTGAGAGIGAATAVKFAEEGAALCLVDKNEENVKRTAAKCGNHIIVVANIDNDDEVKSIVEKTMERFGRLDVLLNIAGIYAELCITQEDTIQLYDRIMATNLRAPVLLTHFAAPHLIKAKGNIVNVSSVASITPVAGNFAYNTSKAGLDHFTKSIASELAPKGVRVNAVNPGPVITDILKDVAIKAQVPMEKYYDDFKNLTALGRASQPVEIAELILFLAGDKAAAITGSTVVIDNGMLVKGNY